MTHIIVQKKMVCSKEEIKHPLFKNRLIKTLKVWQPISSFIYTLDEKTLKVSTQKIKGDTNNVLVIFSIMFKTDGRAHRGTSI